MKKILNLSFAVAILLASCTQTEKTDVKEAFSFQAETFADLKLIRYQVPGFDQLSLEQQKLVYFLSEAGYAGRDIIWDQNYPSVW